MSYSNYEQTVVINGHRLLGVQSVDGSYGINEKPIRVAGVGFIDAVPNAPLQGNFSINRKMVGKDPLLETNSLGKYIYDEAEIDGVIMYDNDTKGFGFTKGRISRYNVTCSVGNVPDIQTDITVYGDLGKNVSSGSTYVVNQLNQYYPFEVDGSYTVAIVYLNGSDVTAQWNDASLTIQYDVYQSLPETTSFRRRGSLKRAYLGKDAFVFKPFENVIVHEDQIIQYPDQSSIKLIVSDFSVDAVVDFSYSRSINVVPVYALSKGNAVTWQTGETLDDPKLEPVQMDTQYPIETDITVTMIANEYEMREIKDRLQAAPRSNITIQICDADDHTNIINSFVGKNVRLISESVNSTIDGEMNISLSYKSYESYHNEI